MAMRYIEMGTTGMMVPQIAMGCMRIASLDVKEAETLINTALENGVNFFDHADIYGKGKSEEIFAKAVSMSPSVREKLIIQSKCAIHDGMYDFSKEHIIKSVDGILKRLNTEYLDVLLLHRPDALMEPDEVAEAFNKLKSEGKVIHFGVSNQNPYQMELLQKSLSQKIAVNQLQLSITNSGMITAGLNVNMENEAGINRDGGVLDYCRLKDITIQPWSPLQYGFFEGVFIDSDKYTELNKKLAEIAESYGVTKSAVAIAWILRHPAKMQPILGTTNLQRFADMCIAADITLTRAEWYDIYKSAGYTLP